MTSLFLVCALCAEIQTDQRLATSSSGLVTLPRSRLAIQACPGKQNSREF